MTRPLPPHGWLGLALWLLALGGSLAGAAWVRAWFYQLAWWGYILLLDGLLARRTGFSLLRDRPRDFLLLAWVSVSFWLGWEIVNLRLENWHYVGVAPGRAERWLGAFTAYATVLPGVHLTHEFLRALGVNWGARCRPIPKSRAWYPWFMATGAIFFILPMLWPRIFFPLVWGGLVFLLEPLNHRLGAPSLMAEWERGDLSGGARWLLAGLVCGLCWESWNWLAGARWVYTIPYLAEPKLFAMPIAGYLGFAPFALECFAFMASLSLLRGDRGGRGWGWEDKGPHQPPRPARPAPSPWLGRLLLAALLPLDLWALWLMDHHLYMSFAP